MENYILSWPKNYISGFSINGKKNLNELFGQPNKIMGLKEKDLYLFWHFLFVVSASLVQWFSW